MHYYDREYEICRTKTREMFGDEGKIKVFPIERSFCVFQENYVYMGFYIKHKFRTLAETKTIKMRIFIKVRTYKHETITPDCQWDLYEVDRSVFEAMGEEDVQRMISPYLVISNSGYYDILDDFDIKTIANVYLELYSGQIRRQIEKIVKNTDFSSIPSYTKILQEIKKDIRSSTVKSENFVEDVLSVLEKWSKREDIPYIVTENLILCLNNYNPGSFINGFKNEYRISGKRKTLLCIDENDFFNGLWLYVNESVIRAKEKEEKAEEILKEMQEEGEAMDRYLEEEQKKEDASKKNPEEKPVM